MELKDFMKRVVAHVHAGPTIVKKSSPAKRAQRRETRFKAVKLKQFQLRREKAVLEERERIRQAKLLASTAEADRDG